MSLDSCLLSLSGTSQKKPPPPLIKKFEADAITAKELMRLFCQLEEYQLMSTNLAMRF